MLFHVCSNKLVGVKLEYYSKITVDKSCIIGLVVKNSINADKPV